MIIDSPELINAYRLLAMKGALKLETLGLRHSQGSIAPAIRQLLNSKTRSKTVLLGEFISHLKDLGILN
jgi:hypothetical protein